MAHREKHRIIAAARRQGRRADGVAVDPSNRTHKPRRGVWCPTCGDPFRSLPAVRLHFLFAHMPAGI